MYSLSILPAVIPPYPAAGGIATPVLWPRHQFPLDWPAFPLFQFYDTACTAVWTVNVNRSKIHCCCIRCSHQMSHACCGTKLFGLRLNVSSAASAACAFDHFPICLSRYAMRSSRSESFFTPAKRFTVFVPGMNFLGSPKYSNRFFFVHTISAYEFAANTSAHAAARYGIIGVYLQVVPKSKPLPGYQKTVLKPAN